MSNFRKQSIAFALSLAFAGAAFAQAAPANTGSPLTEADVRALMTEQGYTEINDVEFKEGVWTADGTDVELKMDPDDGHILGSEQDKVDNKH
jgi:hypothetical protein